MTITSRKHVATTCDELLNHDGWHEIVCDRTRSEGFGGLWLRTFELDCGNNYFIRIFQRECVSLALLSRALSRPYVATFFVTRRGRFGYSFTDISDCSDRSLFYLKLYRTLSERFPL